MLALRVALALPVATAALGSGGWWVTTSSIFRAHRVEVVGSSHLARAEVLRAGGVDPSTNVLWTAPETIESSLEANPWIASAVVTRDLPSTLRIRISERTPASTVMVGSTWFLMARDGTVLGPARARPHLPALPTTNSITVGERSRALVAPAAVAGSMDPWLLARVATVTRGDDGSMQLSLDDGARVLFGPPTEVQAKDQALAGILRWAARSGSHLATIDVRSPIAPSAVPLA
ncbi:MAG: cell division protein FtsQ/DivIB [Actinomycetota bacterium]